MEDHILEMKHISKDYGGIHALLDVNFNLKKGEVLCLCGENGAGKSTLMKILTGVEKPSKGEIYLHGRLAHINRPIDAYRIPTAFLIAFSPSSTETTPCSTR